MVRTGMVGLLLVSLSVVAGVAKGQGAGAASAQAPAAQAAPPPTITGVMDREVSSIEKDVIAAADAMPDDKYDFNPKSLNIPGSSYDNVRTFGDLVKHFATANYFFYSQVVGEKPPTAITGPNGPATMKSKADIMQFLKDSFALGHRAAKGVNSDNLLQTVQVRQNKMPILYAMSFALWHSEDMYGQIVEYLRMNGIVPPASQPKE
jgi:DinB family protein